MSNKFLDFLRKKENVELLRFAGQIIVFVIIVILILFFCSLVSPQFGDITTLLYAICALVALLIVLVISGGLEISIGDIFKVKKDTEEIKKEIALMVRAISKSNAKVNNNFTMVTPTYYEGPPVDIDLTTNSMSTGTVDSPNQEEIDTQEDEVKNNE